MLLNDLVDHLKKDFCLYGFSFRTTAVCDYIINDFNDSLLKLVV